MSRRWIALLVVLVLFAGLFTVLDVRTPPAGVTSTPSQPIPDPSAPIVAIRGQPLAEHEEPLPEGARVRIGSTRFRHPSGFPHESAVVAGRYFISTSENLIVLTDTITGRRVWQERVVFGTQIPDYLHISVSPDGKKLAAWHSASRSSTQVLGRVWNVLADTGQPLRLACSLMMPDGPDNYWVARFVFPIESDDVLLLADGIHTYDSRSGEYLRHLPVKNTILAIDEGGRRFLTSSDHNPFFAFGDFSGMHIIPTYRFRAPNDADKTKQPRRTKRRSIDFSDFRTGPITLMVVDARTGDAVFNSTTFRDCTEPMQHLGLSPDGRYMSYDAGDHVIVFDIDRKIEVLDIPTAGNGDGDSRDYISDSWFSGDSRRFCVRDRAENEHHYDLESGRTVPVRVERLLRYHHFFGSHSQGAVSKHGVVNPAGELPLSPGYAGTVVDFLPDERLLAVGDATGRVDVWRTDGRLIKLLQTDGKAISAITFSPDAKQLATCDKSRVVRVWNAISWRQTQTFDVPADSDHLCPDRLSFSPDGTRLLVSQGDILALWDLNEKNWLWDRAGYGGRDEHSTPAFTPDGTKILTESRSNWIDAATGEDAKSTNPFERLEAQLPAATGIYSWRDHSSMALSPTGLDVALIDGKGLLQFWNVADDRLVRTFPESHNCETRRGILRFSPDGRRLVTCDNHGHAHVWEVATGQLAYTINYPDGDIADAFFTKDGRSLITSNHREVIVWGLTAEPGAEKTAWADLTQEAPKAEQARRALLANPAATVELIREKLTPVKPLDRAEVNRLVGQLEAGNFRSREQAASRLCALGRRVLPFLKDAKLESPEGKARLAATIRDLSAGLTGDERREVRCLELLGQIDTPPARELIRKLATGDPLAVLTEEAKKSARQ